MKTNLLKYEIILIMCFMLISSAVSQVSWNGQFSGWSGINEGGYENAIAGVRYIPDFSVQISASENAMLDMRLSANAYYSMLQIEPFNTSSNIKLYRFWLRYSTSQLEIRAGLQKINFGSSMMLRPLMWFDRIDVRDPLQITEGVYGILGRYYLLNNANFWIWVLYGNVQPKGWEITKTAENSPEIGARFQHPVFNGEMALTYHYRNAIPVNLSTPDTPELAEQQFGLDGKWDIGIGIWSEISMTIREKHTFLPRNQKLINIGADYTFGWGNGLNIVWEQFQSSFGDQPESFENKQNISLLYLNYPLSILDNISGMVYYDWNSENIYRFFRWGRNYDNWSIFGMLFWNPESAGIYGKSDQAYSISGKGIQIMLTYNH